MSIEEIEAEALKLDPKDRARLAGKLLESLEDLSEKENTRLSTSPAEELFRDARGKLTRHCSGQVERTPEECFDT